MAKAALARRNRGKREVLRKAILALIRDVRREQGFALDDAHVMTLGYRISDWLYERAKRNVHEESER